MVLSSTFNSISSNRSKKTFSSTANSVSEKHHNSVSWSDHFSTSRSKDMGINGCTNCGEMLFEPGSPSKFWKDSLTSDSDSVNKIDKSNDENSHDSTSGEFKITRGIKFQISPHTISSKDDAFEWDYSRSQNHMCYEDSYSKCSNCKQYR